MASRTHLIELCKGIYEVLNKAGEENWAEIVRLLIAESDSISDDQLQQKILKLFIGGMGSFNDLIIHRRGKMAVAENQQLHRLRRDLYDAAIELSPKN